MASFITAFLPLLASFPLDVSGPMLYGLHRGEPEKAFTTYLDYVKECQSHDFSLLQQAAKTLLEEGIESADPETELLCMFGAGVATSAEMLPILEKGIHSKDMRTQLVALSYLGKQFDDEADEILLDALASPFLLVRLEALLHLAKNNHPETIGYLQALMVKVPPELKFIFSQIAIHVESADATRLMKQFLTDPDAEVRTEAVLAAVEGKRDDFLPLIRNLALGASYAQQEICALAFGALKDHLSIEKLKNMTASKEACIKLAACISLFELGEREFLKEIEADAKKGSLFAISALGKIPESKETLAELITHPERDVRVNAILALLSQNDRRALQYIDEILLEDARDTGFWQMTSPSGGLKAWRTISSASQHDKQYPGIMSQTLGVREAALVLCLEYEEEDFLKIARKIFARRQHTLIPVVIELLENKKSAAVIQFLKEGHQKAGAPLIRNYCTLALYRLHEEGPYEEQLIAYVKTQSKSELIRFKEEGEAAPSPFAPHALTPEETSQFLIEACEALASAQSQAGLETLIHTIAYGNPKNRYALAGLLMRTTE